MKRSGRRGVGKVRIALAGLGEFETSLIQGITYYAEAHYGACIPGLMLVDPGGHGVAISRP